MPDSDNEPQALKEVLEGLALSQRPQRTEGAETGDDAPHAFWDTQPVPHAGEDLTTIDVSQMGPIDPADMDAVRKEPYNLPPSFEWSDVDLGDAAQAKELYTLLHENYVEDGDQMFRFDYSVPFLKWALQPPGSLIEWMVGVRVSQTKKLVAFISCTPAVLTVHGTRVQPHHALASSATDKVDAFAAAPSATGVGVEGNATVNDGDVAAAGSSSAAICTTSANLAL